MFFSILIDVRSQNPDFNIGPLPPTDFLIGLTGKCFSQILRHKEGALLQIEFAQCITFFVLHIDSTDVNSRKIKKWFQIRCIILTI